MTHDAPDRPTLEAHPGLDDEGSDAGKMMTAEGSRGPKRRKDEPA